MLNLSIISCSVVPSSNGPHQFRTCPSCVSSAPEQEDHRCNKRNNMLFIPQPHRHCHVGSPLRSPPVPPLQCWCVTILRTTGEDPRKINGIHPQRAPFNIEVGGLGARPSQEQQAECDRKGARPNHFLFIAVCVASDGVGRCPLVCGPGGFFLVLEFDHYSGPSYCGPKHR